MCWAKRCTTCGKMTWAGCGLHVESALAPYSKDERCQCGKSLFGYVADLSETLTTDEETYKSTHVGRAAA